MRRKGRRTWLGIYKGVRRPGVGLSWSTTAPSATPSEKDWSRIRWAARRERRKESCGSVVQRVSETRWQAAAVRWIYIPAGQPTSILNQALLIPTVVTTIGRYRYCSSADDISQAPRWACATRVMRCCCLARRLHHAAQKSTMPPNHVLGPLWDLKPAPFGFHCN